MLSALGILSGSPSTLYATWSPTNKSSRITTPVSGDNLKFAGSGSPFVGTGIATIGKSSGKWYWEVTITSSTTTSVAKVGICGYIPVSGNTVALGQGTVVGGTAPSYGYRGGNTQPCVLGPVSGSNTGSTSCTAQAVTQVYSFLLDMDNGDCHIYINGVLKTTITGLLGTTWYPACGSDASSGAGTANFGSGGPGSFTYYASIGAGYNPGVYN